jgi:hypothetical protein
MEAIMILFLSLFTACKDVHDHDHDHDHELISTVVLTYTDEAGEESSFHWNDMGGTADVEIDDIVLSANTVYQLDVHFFNELEEEPEDLTSEIKSEGSEHQVFFTGNAITENLLLHSYSDNDENNLPIGLTNSMESAAAGSGELTVTLRHMPLEDGNTIKEENLQEIVLEEGFGNIGGANDVSVTFPVTVE